jgi:hypothetical protein
MALTTDLRPSQGAGPLEYAFVLLLVAALTSLAVVVVGMAGSGRLTEAGSCLTSSVCSVGGLSNVPRTSAASVRR